MEQTPATILMEAVILVLGADKLWKYLSDRAKSKKEIESKAYADDKGKIALLEAEIRKYNETILDLTAKSARLEERILLTAKNRVKGH